MRLAPTLVVSSLAIGLAPLVSAHSARSLSSLQHHHQPRLIDLCIDIPSIAVNILSLLGVNVEACVCLKDLDLYLQTTDNVTLKNSAIAEVDALIGAAPNGGNCTVLPAHAHRACTNATPCRFLCDTGFTLTPKLDACVCSPPNVICNGQCGPPTAGCGASAVARSVRSRETRITTLEHAQKICGPKKTVCGVAHPKSELDFDCVDVTRDFDSCAYSFILFFVFLRQHFLLGGGCVTAHPFQPKSGVPTGTDCGRISNALEVSCQESKCVVQRCMSGFAVRGDECVPSSQKVVHRSKMHKQRRDLNLGIIDLSLGSSSMSTPMIASSMVPSMAAVMAATSAISNMSMPSSPVSQHVVVLLGIIRITLGSDETTLCDNVNLAVNETQDAQTALASCGCSSTLGGLGPALASLLNGLLGLQSACAGGVPPTVPGPPSCLNVNLSKVVCGLLPSVYIGPLILCGLSGLLGPDLIDTVQKLLNGLGIGQMPPATSCVPGSSAPDALPPAAMNVTTLPPAATNTTTNTTTPPTTVDPSAGPVLGLVSIVVDIAVKLNLNLSDVLGCGGLLDALNGLVKQLLGGELIGRNGLIATGSHKRNLLGGLLDLGGASSGAPGALDGLTDKLTPLITDVLALVNGCPAAGGLGGLLNDLLAAVENLLNGLLGCTITPALLSAVQQIQSSAAANMTASTSAPASKRAIKF
ncbi:hypothetical protein C8R43DRAFT_11326 [Mycena crocata]|nr:hypothetical protein C8R43DRAFT_11326 [Mycena crocata]